MTETPIEPVATASPWAESPVAASAPDLQQAAPKPASPVSTVLWGLASTLALAAWISWQTHSWVWGAAAVAGVFVHEFGHVLAINWAGSGPSRIRIIPFFGGAASMERPAATELKGVLIALAGPVFGLLAALPFFGLAAATGDRRWLTGAIVIAGFNLLNLAPAPPLDGSKALGPVLARIHPLLERAVLLLIGLAAVAWTVADGSWLIALVIGLSIFASLRTAQLRPAARPLSWGEWGLSLGLCLISVLLCAGVLLAAAVAHANPQSLSGAAS
ncbi:MAG TPA: M50 family metallopeptidase [Caulobacteraceae bacterium]|jgi:Zn-dependent protease|nr:M50 family metallopeptidase [Caulobacteraceae bacterium]